MREIKFRGKSLNGWVYGQYVVIQEKHNPAESTIWDIHLNIGIPINYKTLGQYTGLKDKNGVEIYEGDIVKLELETYSDTYKIVKNLYEAFVIDNNADTLTVVGNIYENPELMEGLK